MSPYHLIAVIQVFSLLLGLVHLIYHSLFLSVGSCYGLLLFSTNLRSIIRSFIGKLWSFDIGSHGYKFPSYICLCFFLYCRYSDIFNKDFNSLWNCYYLCSQIVVCINDEKLIDILVFHHSIFMERSWLSHIELTT